MMKVTTEKILAMFRQIRVFHLIDTNIMEELIAPLLRVEKLYPEDGSGSSPKMVGAIYQIAWHYIH